MYQLFELLVLDGLVCANGDVGQVDDGTPFIYWDSQWYPICGHYFWDNDVGSSLYCEKLGYSNGIVQRSETDEKYAIESFRLGLCNENDPLTSCSGGCNDYKAGGYCGSRNYWDRGNGNSNARCEKQYSPKIRIKCHDGNKSISVSCRGGML